MVDSLFKGRLRWGKRPKFSMVSWWIWTHSRTVGSPGFGSFLSGPSGGEGRGAPGGTRDPLEMKQFSLFFCIIFFLMFLWILSLKWSRNTLKSGEKSSEIALGTPLGVKNVILAKLQYLPCENHDFRGSEGPQTSENLTAFFKKVSESTSSPKSVFRSWIFSVFS